MVKIGMVIGDRYEVLEKISSPELREKMQALVEQRLRELA